MNVKVFALEEALKINQSKFAKEVTLFRNIDQTAQEKSF